LDLLGFFGSIKAGESSNSELEFEVSVSEDSSSSESLRAKWLAIGMGMGAEDAILSSFSFLEGMAIGPFAVMFNDRRYFIFMTS